MFNISDTQIVCIDIQEKLVKMLENGEKIAKNCEKMIKAASVLAIDTIITEQYPKGLGETVFNTFNFEKTEKISFSAYQDIKYLLKKPNILVFGIETHICVLQSVMDLLEKNYNIYVIEDCSSSRSNNDHKIALELMKQKGASIITLETALFQLLKSSRHPDFKEIQGLIK